MFFSKFFFFSKIFFFSTETAGWQLVYNTKFFFTVFSIVLNCHLMYN